jgi:hypothetical protein
LGLRDGVAVDDVEASRFREPAQLFFERPLGSAGRERSFSRPQTLIAIQSFGGSALPSLT